MRKIILLCLFFLLFAGFTYVPEPPVLQAGYVVIILDKSGAGYWQGDFPRAYDYAPIVVATHGHTDGDENVFISAEGLSGATFALRVSGATGSHIRINWLAYPGGTD